MIGLVVNSIITTYVELIELWLVYNYTCVQRVEINTPEFTISIVKQVIVECRAIDEPNNLKPEKYAASL